MFRRLYWVTEEVAASGDSGVTGVYTSIPDLVKNGIQSRNGQPSRFRLSLVKLDSARGTLGTWEAPGFSGIEDALQPFVQKEDFTADQCQSLVDHLKRLGSVKA
jgi:hypothetical protein